MERKISTTLTLIKIKASLTSTLFNVAESSLFQETTSKGAAAHCSSGARTKMVSLRIFSISLYVTTTLVIFLLNFPVIIILLSGRCMGRRIRNVHILSLSITDCLVSVSSLFLFHALRVTDGISDPPPPLQYARCWLALSVYLCCTVASLLHLCFICADRWWILTKNYSSERTKRVFRFWMIVLATWGCSFTIVFVPFTVLRRDHAITICTIPQLFLDFGAHIIFRTWGLLLFLGLFFIIASCGWMLFRILNLQKAMIHPSQSKGDNAFTISKPRVILVKPKSDQPDDDKVPTTSQKTNVPRTSHKPNTVNVKQLSLGTIKLVSHRRAVVTLLILAGCLLFCLSPLCAVCFLMGWKEKSVAINQDAIYFVCVVSSLNSAFNPLVYAFRVNEVRHNIRALKKKLSCCFCSLLWHID